MVRVETSKKKGKVNIGFEADNNIVDDNDTNATNGNVVVKKDVDVEGKLAFELGTSMSR